jgi:hypothetical protein
MKQVLPGKPYVGVLIHVLVSFSVEQCLIIYRVSSYNHSLRSVSG